MRRGRKPYQCIGKTILDPPMPGDAIRFLLKTKLGAIPTLPGWDRGPCWLWTGAKKNDTNYGHFWFAGLRRLAHRCSYHFFRGRITDGNDIDHECRNEQCVNPTHLADKGISENRSDNSPTEDYNARADDDEETPCETTDCSRPEIPF